VDFAVVGGGDIIGNTDIQECSKLMSEITSGKFFFRGNGSFENFTNDRERAGGNIRLDVATMDPRNIRCLVCNEGPRIGFCVPCGHKVVCSSCAPQTKLCPLCRFQVNRITVMADESDLCGVCFDNVADTIILPCGHIGYCHQCMMQWFERQKSCPTCREKDATYKTLLPDY
jgi:hypothetical protein